MVAYIFQLVDLKPYTQEGFLHEYNVSLQCTEVFYTTDCELFGLRGLYNLSNHGLEGNIKHGEVFANKKEVTTNGIKASVVERNEFDEQSNSDNMIYESDLTIGAEWWQRESIDDVNAMSNKSPELKGDV
ncbi:hypothetical protein C2G38_2218086 [Gigaspora rosea]|uniref:Uncharacterized protein n=1 Tax=Gigaspora rosea TaxID=44941 RepID=A0A397U721_9GLOM|nr:hypothetical protein C2G38_2218086 [Gigaspora rosea]